MWTLLLEDALTCETNVLGRMRRTIIQSDCLSFAGVVLVLILLLARPAAVAGVSECARGVLEQLQVERAQRRRVGRDEAHAELRRAAAVDAARRELANGASRGV